MDGNLCYDIYKKIFNHSPTYYGFCPYRICPLGAHVDHQLGCVTGIALSEGVYITYSPQSSRNIDIHSINFRETIQVGLSNEHTTVGTWSDYVSGTLHLFTRIYRINAGIKAVIYGSLPIGGIASSSALILAILSALCKANGIVMKPQSLIDFVVAVENQYIGVQCGQLDPSCEILCEKNSLLFLDTLNNSYCQVHTKKFAHPYEIAIIYSGLQRKLVNSKYNHRREECIIAAQVLSAFVNDLAVSPAECRLRMIPEIIFQEHKDLLPISLRKRAEHFYSENERVRKGIIAWQQGDIIQFGDLVFQSGLSSIQNYDVGCKELNMLFHLLETLPGIYGARFSGAGFGGCCIALIDPNQQEVIERQITDRYLHLYPKYKSSFMFKVCKSASGILPHLSCI